MIKFNKKIIAFLLVIITLLSLSACDNQIASEPSKTSPVTTSSIKIESSSEQQENIKSSSSKLISATTTSKNSSTSKNNSSSSKKVSTSAPQNSTSSPKKPNSRCTPKLYKVADKNGNIAWLFGSIHVGKATFFPLPNYVSSALYGSDVVAVEFDLIAFEDNINAQTEAMTAMISPKQSTKSHLKGDDAMELYNKAVEILSNNNVYNSAMRFYKPVLWSMLIDNIVYDKIGADSSYGIDRYVIKTAYKHNIKVEDIESAKSQYEMLAGFSDELQTSMLAGSVKSYNDPNSKKELDELMDIWSKGDFEKLRQMLKQDSEEMQKENSKLFNEYNSAMKTKRDAVMTQYVMDALNAGKEAFVCVGAAHIAQENGIVDSLKAKGYTVTEVN